MILLLRYFTIFGSVLLLSYSNALSQNKQTSIQQLYWLRYYNIWRISRLVEWHNELDTRHFFDNSQRLQWIQHSRIHYRIGPKINLAAGFTYSLQGNQQPDIPNTTLKPELRLVQEINYHQNILPNTSLSLRTRFDERFFLATAQSPSSFTFRHRYRLQISHFFKKANLTLRLNDELMYNVQNRREWAKLDQNRIYFAVEKRFSPSLAVEVGYLNIFQAARQAGLYYERHILRLTLHHTI